MLPIIAPSLLSANFLNLERDIAMLNGSEAEWFHLDVMDGVFVPNISFGFPIIEKIRQSTDKVLDVHLMIIDPDRYLERFRKSGADVISIHMEACTNPVASLKAIRKLGAKAGIVINPATPVNVLEPVIHEANMVLIMSVNPGFGGQSFMAGTLEKVATLKAKILEKNLAVLIEVDGGIDLRNAPLLVSAGADILVAGNTIFSSVEPATTIHLLRNPKEI